MMATQHLFFFLHKLFISKPFYLNPPEIFASLKYYRRNKIQARFLKFYDKLGLLMHFG